jgi:hypothetical protein
MIAAAVVCCSKLADSVVVAPRHRCDIKFSIFRSPISGYRNVFDANAFYYASSGKSVGDRLQRADSVRNRRSFRQVESKDFCWSSESQW